MLFGTAIPAFGKSNRYQLDSRFIIHASLEERVVYCFPCLLVPEICGQSVRLWGRSWKYTYTLNLPIVKIKYVHDVVLSLV